MLFSIRATDSLPIYRQIEQQVLDGIVQGHLKPGEKLPSHRDLAQELVIAPLTVKKAYDTLESQGVIEMRRGHGTFVRESLPRVTMRERRERLRGHAKRLLLEAGAAGASWQEVIDLLEEEEKRLSLTLRRD